MVRRKVISLFEITLSSFYILVSTFRFPRFPIYIYTEQIQSKTNHSDRFTEASKMLAIKYNLFSLLLLNFYNFSLPYLKDFCSKLGFQIKKNIGR